MTQLVFTLRAEPEQRLDLSKLTPDRLVGRSEKEIAAIEIGTTKHSVKVGDVFKVGLGEAHSLRFEGGSNRFDLLGAKLLPGFSIEVAGDVGAQLGRGALGGTIKVSGDAGPFVGSKNVGAHIEIGGDAGDFLGGPLAGEVAGMSGGRIIVRGNAGVRAGDRLRRGIIIIEGNAGDNPCSRVVAGTIIVLGDTSGSVGYLNKRGSIILGKIRDFGPTYVDCGAHELTFAKLFAKALAADSARASSLLSQKLRRFGGDTAVFGKGEILTPM